jgi:glycosyltransferase involved in cell wall biosynthesis/GT2 family glycosyltransferase
MDRISIAFLDLIGLVYDGNALNKRGLGGSESAIILMSRELVKLGFDVTVFCACEDEDNKPGTYDGVVYRPVESLDKNDKFDIVISSRTVIPFVPDWMYEHFDTSTAFPCKLFKTIRDNAKYRILWMHDTFCRGDQAIEDLLVYGNIDKIFTLSDFHTSYITNCDHGYKKRNFEVLKNKTFITRNGAVNYFDEVDISQKDPFLYVYNASLTKGMIPLIDYIWPEFKKRVPEAKLKVIGGYYKFRSDGPLDEQGVRWHQLVKEQKYKDLDIDFTGIIPQREIAEILSRASFFAYPCAFPETFGISTLESLLYNTPVLGTRFGALEETAVEAASYLIDYAIEPNGLFPKIDASEQNAKFVEMMVRAHHDSYLHQQKQYYCNIVKDVAGWDTVALQWKQHFYKFFKKYLPVEEYRNVSYINDKVHRVFGRRFSNPQEWNTLKANKERHINIISPFYNAENYIKDLIMSTATQDYESWTHYLLDDSSTDDSLKVLVETLAELPVHLRAKYKIAAYKENRGAVRNQVDAIRDCQDGSLIMLLDGDDCLMPDNNIFNYYNRLFENDKTEYAYGSCWSLADNIPLIAQPYPLEVRRNKSYRTHKFNWGMPYPHLRVFRKDLINNLEDYLFQDEAGEWYRAGGDNATFYNIIEQADPDKIVAVQDIFYIYNDKNPLNDYKVNGEIQNINAGKIANRVYKQPAATPRNAGRSRNNLGNSANNPQPLPVIEIDPTISRVPLSFKTNEGRESIQDSETEDSNITKKKKILIAIPMAKYIEVQTFKAVYDLDVPDNVETVFQYFYGYNVDQVRNLIADWVVKGDYDYLFAVDYDIAFPSDTLTKFLSYDKDAVSAIYKQRVPDRQTIEVFKKNEQGGYYHIPYDELKDKGLVEVDACGFGCVLIKRKVFEDIGYPQFEYKSAISHEHTFSEDLDFCRKATNLGFKIYADTSVICDHYGQYNFRIS